MMGRRGHVGSFCVERPNIHGSVSAVPHPLPNSIVDVEDGQTNIPCHFFLEVSYMCHDRGGSVSIVKEQV
jgi:hypothetical protein